MLLTQRTRIGMNGFRHNTTANRVAKGIDEKGYWFVAWWSDRDALDEEIA